MSSISRSKSRLSNPVFRHAAAGLLGIWGATEAAAQATELPPVTIEPPTSRRSSRSVQDTRPSRASEARTTPRRTTNASRPAAQTRARLQQPPTAPVSDPAPPGPLVVEGEKITRDYFRTYTSVGIATDRDIRNYSVNELKQSYDLMANVRSFQGAGGNNGFVVRGFNSEGVTQPSRSTPIVSVIIDGAPQNIETMRRGSRGVWDVEQIEVLRGPQSTLQGWNSLAGAVIVKTKDPTFWPELIIDGQLGSQDHRSGAFVVNTPLVGNQAALRVSGQMSGENKDIRYSDPSAVPLRKDEFEQLRAKLLITPDAIPGLTALFTVSRTHDKPGLNGVTGPAFFARRYDVNAQSGIEFRDATVSTYIADLNYELSPGWNLRSVTAFSDSKVDIWTPQGATFKRNEERKGQDISQDLRLTFDPVGSPLSGVVGLFAGRFRTDIESLITTDLLAPFGIPTARIQDLNQRNTTTSIAAYADLRYRFAERWTLLAGGRVLRDEVKNEARGEALDQATTEFNIGYCMFVGCVPTAAYLPLDERASAAKNVVLPKLGLAYDLTDNQTLAATATQGYRTGFGELVPGNTTITTIKPEFLWSYELAYRSRWLDDRLQLNANVYYYDYKNQQILVSNPRVPGGTFTENAGKSHAYGSEVEMRWRPLDQLTLFTSLGLSKTEFDEAQSSIGDLKGKRFPEAPAITFAAGGFWKHQSGFFAGADMSYTDGFHSSGDLANSPSRWVGAYTLANARLGWEFRHATVTLFARNLFDQKYLTFIGVGRAEAVIGEGRTVGIRTSMRF